jgi:trk system potassium uptake protein TrkA
VKIVILGAGQVGASVAEALASEASEITMVDQDRERLAKMAERLDIRTVVGNGAYPSVLRDAGVEDADMLVAVTQSDQTNLVACKIARTLFHVPTRLARLRSADFLDDKRLLSDENFAVDYAICPEQDITDYIVKLVQFPEALQVLEFANGRVTLVCVRAVEGGLLVGKPVREMKHHVSPMTGAWIAAIFREHQSVDVEGDTVIEAGDEVFLLAASEHIRSVMQELRRMLEPVRTVMIAGGGHIGAKVAAVLERDHQVRLIESNRPRAEQIAGELGKSVVLCGDATDENLLEQEHISEMDMFLALTNDDENNIMAASLAKRLGCKRVLALINRRAYADMVQGGPIDIGISPAQVSIGSLLTYVRRGDVARVHSLRRGAAEALELVAHGNRTTSKVVGRRIDELPKLKGARIAAIVRHGGESVLVASHGVPTEIFPDQVIIPHHDTVIEDGDHVVVFCVRKRLVHEVEKLFQVGAGYI